LLKINKTNYYYQQQVLLYGANCDLMQNIYIERE